MSISVVVTARTIFAHEFEQTRGDSGGQRSLVLQSMKEQRVGLDLVTKQQENHIVTPFYYLPHRPFYTLMN